MKLDTGQKLLTRTEVEEQFGITKRFLEVSASNGVRPRIVRLGRNVRYRTRDITEFIEQSVDEPLGKQVNCRIAVPSGGAT